MTARFLWGGESVTRRYFGTDGIRGRVGEPMISPDFVLKLGWAAGHVLGNGWQGPDRQGHPHLRLHVRVGPGGRPGGGGARRAPARPHADAGGRLPHPHLPRRGRHRHHRLPQPLPGQRHQVLLRRRRQAPGRGRARHRGTDRSAAAYPRSRQDRQGQAHRRRPGALHRVLQEHHPLRHVASGGSSWWWTAPTGPPTT